MNANGHQQAPITTPISSEGDATLWMPDRKRIRKTTLRKTCIAPDVTVRKESVRLEERTRIARELHDTLLQVFLGASMQLDVVADGLPGDSPVRARLERILQLMKQGIEDGRDTLNGLRLSDYRILDLVTALSGIREELLVQPDIDFRIVVAGRQQPLRPPIAHEIYRIAREALVNAFRHSGGKCVELELKYTVSEFHTRIRDNGFGINPHVLQAGREGHWGLSGMRERATRIGGRLNISSRVTVGTEIHLSVPGRIAFQPSALIATGSGTKSDPDTFDSGRRRRSQHDSVQSKCLEVSHHEPPEKSSDFEPSSSLKLGRWAAGSVQEDCLFRSRK